MPADRVADRAAGHARPWTARRRRAATGLTATAVTVITVCAGVAWRGVAAQAAPPAAAAGSLSGRTVAGGGSRPSGRPSAGMEPAATVAGKPQLTASDRSSCPPAASACVDLTDHITWLQSDGRVTFGPVRMEPGPPGTPHATPRGTFHVQWKAGANYISTTYHEPMPWAVFFAPGGVAFHGGSLTTPSHGCVHLTIGNALYYHNHLPIGAEVVVF
jgi:L,D-transpeptidase catalytic domain